MTITFEQLHASWEALNRLVAARPDDPLVAVRIARLWRAVKPEYDKFTEAMVPMMLRFGAEQIEDRLVVPPARMAAFQAEAGRLFADTIEIPAVRLNVGDLPRGLFSAIDLGTLGWLLAEPDEG